MKKAALLAGIYAALAMNAMNEITNPYDGLPEMRYNGNKQPERKTQLTKKQKKKGLRLSLHVKFVGSNAIRIATNVMRLGEGCLTDAQFSHKFQWQLLPNRCYVLGGLSALNLIFKRNGKFKRET